MSTNKVLDQIRAERDQARSAALAIAEGDNFDPKDENFLALQERAEALDARAGSLATLLEQQAASDALDGRLSKAMRSKEVDVRKGAESSESRSLGDLFVRSEAFGEYSQAPRGRMPRLDMTFQERALPTGLSDLVSAGLPMAKSDGGDIQPPVAPTPILDNSTRVQVTTNAIEFVTWSKVAGGAAIVPEKGAKPSAEWAPNVTSDSLDNIAVYTQLTRQLIEDQAAVRSLINGELVRDVRREEERQAALALAAAVTAGDVPTFTGSLAGGDDLLGVIRAGIGTVQSSGYTPNAVLLNPSDWAELDNVVMSSTLNGPQVRQNFWGLTPIADPNQTAGSAIVGDFRTALRQYYRSEVSLYITDSHADTFLMNVFTLLAERRTLAKVIRPDALVNVTVGA